MTESWRQSWRNLLSRKIFCIMANGLVRKRIALFGSTGSIGRQALEVIDANPTVFSVEVLTAQTSDELLIRQALHFKPNIVVIGDEKKYGVVRDALASQS